MQIALILGVALALILGVGLIERAIRRTTFGAGVIFLSFAVSAAFDRTPAVSLAGARISVTDVAASVVLAAAVARVLRTRVSGPHALVVALLAVLGVSLARGAVVNGFDAALNDFRIFMRYFGAVLYFSTVQISPSLSERLGRMWTWLAGGLTVILALRWANRLVGIPIGMFNATYDAPIRVLDGPQSFFYAETLLVVLPATAVMAESDRRRRLVFAAALLLVNLALNRRTVFAALLVGVAALIVRNPAFRRQALRAVVAVAVIGLVVALLGPPETATDEEVGQSTTDTGTLEWRIAGWRHLLDEHFEGGVVQVLFGQPMGNGYEREAIDTVVESNPHSWYVHVLLRGGVIGLLLMLALFAYVLWSLHRPAGTVANAPPSRFDYATLWTLLLAELVWFLTWEPHELQGMVLGLAVAVAAGLGSGSTRVESRSEHGRGAPASRVAARWRR